jgi:pimeloyl-ACP methyl ester carboxylesterase
VKKIITKKRLLISAVVIFLAAAGALYYAHRSFYSVPQTRLALDKNYSEMPEDDFHHYIDLPVDHKDLSKGSFRGFYLFSPNFYKSKNITFLLTDGQMELVGLKTDFGFFEDVLKENSYVLIGVRGHSPTLFPEVFKNGQVDYEEALNLYNSDQQIEDIEMVRLDLIKKGLLPAEDKINVFGASGAGVLAQQYLSKYGANVNRVILESTGAPDLSKKNNSKYSPDFKDFNPPAANLLESLLGKKSVAKKTVSNILYQIGRTEKSPREAQVKLLEDLRNGGGLWSYKLKPIMNLSVLNYIIKTPDELAARVRWFELVGYDLMRYDSEKETNLLYEISAEAVSDIIDYHKRNNRSPKEFVIERNNFSGEVLILKGTEDVVFSDAVNVEIQKSYPNARLLFFKDGHRMQNDKTRYQKLRTIFLEKGFESAEFINLAEPK